jgi:K+ transporter
MHMIYTGGKYDSQLIIPIVNWYAAITVAFD